MGLMTAAFRNVAEYANLQEQNMTKNCNILDAIFIDFLMNLAYNKNVKI